MIGPNLQTTDFHDNSIYDAAWHSLQDDLDKWAASNFDQQTACSIMSWSDRVAQFVVSRRSDAIKRLGARLAELLDADDWNNIEPLLLAAIPQSSR